MLKPLFQGFCLLVLTLFLIFAPTNIVFAHELKSNSAAEREKHRQIDFGYPGFEQLNKDLQNHYNKFNFKLSAAQYRRFFNMPSPPDSHLTGSWSPLINLPVVSIHAAVLPNRKVLMWDSIGDLPSEHYEVHNKTRAVLWDPANGSIKRYDVRTGFNLFCAGHYSLPNGKQFIAGGNLNAQLDGLDKLHTFNSSNNTWSLIGQMEQGGRWYPSVTMTGGAEMLITAGGPATPEVYTSAGTLRSLTDAVLEMPDYPWFQAAPNGQALYFGPGDAMWYFNTSGRGAMRYVDGRDGLNREYGSYAMFDIGKVLAAGGGSSVRHSAVIDMNGSSVQVTQTGDLNTGRRQHNLTVLPDGSVLATGGNFSGASLVDLNAGVYTAELWSPATNQWQTLASMQKTRQYHSTALLLADGRVLVGGGGICLACHDVGYIEKNMEIFSPPYLFNRDGSGTLAARPTITNAPSTVSHLQEFTISTPNAAAISQVVLVRTSSVTHSVNFEQRRVPLNFSLVNGAIRAAAPLNGHIAPPGFYMLFVIDNQGVPSVARMIKVNPNSALASNASYNFFAAHSDKIMEVSGASLTDGAGTAQTDISNGANQVFRLRKVGTDYQIIAAHSNKCLESRNDSPDEGALITQITCNNINYNQRWQFTSIPDSAGGYQIKNQHGEKCLAVAEASQSNGGQLIQTACTGAANQIWKLRRR